MLVIFVLLSLSLFIFSIPALLIVRRYFTGTLVHLVKKKLLRFFSRLHKKRYYETETPFNRHYAFDLTVTGLIVCFVNKSSCHHPLLLCPAVLCPFFASSFILICLKKFETEYYFVLTVLALRHLESASHQAMYLTSSFSR